MLARVGAVIVEQDNPKYYLVSYRFSFFFFIWFAAPCQDCVLCLSATESDLF